MRIVSLLPSATEILFELGSGEDVSITFECDVSPDARARRVVSTSALPPDLTPVEIDAVVKDPDEAKDSAAAPTVTVVPRTNAVCD